MEQNKYTALSKIKYSLLTLSKLTLQIYVISSLNCVQETYNLYCHSLLLCTVTYIMEQYNYKNKLLTCERI